MNARPGIVLLYQHLKPARSSPATLGRISAFSETLNSSQVLLGMDFTSQTIDPTGVSLVRGARTARGVVQSLAEDVDNSQLWKVFGLHTAAGRNLKKLYQPPLSVPLPGRSRSRLGDSDKENFQNTWSSPFLATRAGPGGRPPGAPKLAW
eukprot:g31360.t1